MRKPARSSGRLALSVGFLGILSLAGLGAMLGAFDSGQMIQLSRRLLAPSWQHWMGTDALGRDVLALICAGSISSLGVAVVAVGSGALIGVPAGILASVRRGIFSDLVSRGGDLVFAFPALLLAVLLTASLGPGAFTAIIAIAVFNTPVFARIVRSQCESLMARDFILAARMANRSTPAIAFEHLLPNVIGLVTVQIAIQMSLAIVAESGLSYIGLGVQPPAASWGRMLAEAQTLLSVAPWLAAFPGAVLACSVLALNTVADALSRDIEADSARNAS